MSNYFRVFFFVFISSFLNKNVYSLCHLPNHWAGKWYHGKGVDILNINRTHFINRGSCIEQKQDKFLFYEQKEECFRCIFIMQKHVNVLQYRASYCTDQSDFNANCENLSPESELITVYRDNPISERCPLNGLYVLNKPNGDVINDDDRSYRSSNGHAEKCVDSKQQQSMIMECSDHSMLKLQFGKCTNMPTFIINCVAHWTEGNTNYLIGKVTSENKSDKPVYKCLVYTESTSNSNDPRQKQQDQSANRHSRHQQSYSDFIDLTGSSSFIQSGEQLHDSSKIQLSISQDEFCRNIDNMIIDEQLSFSFTKVIDSKYHLAPAPYVHSAKQRRVRQHPNTQANHTHITLTRKNIYNINNRPLSCKFPKWLNKKWHNLKQTKLFTLDYKLDSLLVFDEKNSIIINKFTCSHMRLKRANHVQAVVKSLNGCSTGYQCLSITSKSEFVLELKFGRISADISSIDCSDYEYTNQEFVYIDTNYGVQCPFRNGIYEKLNPKFSNSRSVRRQSEKQIDSDEPCKYLTQTQTLQVGCENEQQYSLRTKLCYPNNNKYEQQLRVEQQEQETSKGFLNSNNNEINPYAIPTSSKSTTNSYTQLESEINLVCMAHWRHENNIVIVSRTMTNEMLCSIWSVSDDGRLIQLLEIDSNCNYNKDTHQRINYGFVYLNSCNAGSDNEQTKKHLSVNKIDSVSLTSSSSSFSFEYSSADSITKFTPFTFIAFSLLSSVFSTRLLST